MNLEQIALKFYCRIGATPVSPQSLSDAERCGDFPSAHVFNKVRLA
jgi:hypothetical protein